MSSLIIIRDPGSIEKPPWGPDVAERQSSPCTLPIRNYQHHDVIVKSRHCAHAHHARWSIAIRSVQNLEQLPKQTQTTEMPVLCSFPTEELWSPGLLSGSYRWHTIVQVPLGGLSIHVSMSGLQ